MEKVTILLSALLALPALDALEVQVPELPVVALFGQDATLNCSFAPVATHNVTDLAIFWQLTDTKRSVHGYWSGQDQLTDQGEGFANRTSLFHGELRRGNASLLLRKVRISDEGSYTCFVKMETHGRAALLLQVAAPYSKPVVNLEPDSNLRPGDEVSLTCLAYGGFPEAGLQWQDGVGHNLTDNVTTSWVANEEGLFSVRSVLRLVLEPDNTYNCRLSNLLLGEEGHASVTVTGQSWAFPPVALGVTVGLAVCLLGLLAALAVVCRRKIKESCEEADAAGESKLEEDESRTAMTPLKS